MTFLALLTAGWLMISDQVRLVPGSVRDPTGLAIAGATITATSPEGGDTVTRTDAEGRFTVAVPADGLILVVSAADFHPVRRVVAADVTGPIEVMLTPSITEFVSVTSGRTEQRLENVAGTVTIMGRERLDRTPAATSDEVLKQIPAFSLFRRSSSVAAHPTAQGVSLRGIGPSGVSRTLVLLDGIPFNDPFGGWVSWTRVPRASLDRIEVVEGTSANLFGNHSMGGAINLVTVPAARSRVDLTMQYGERETPRVDASLSGRRGGWHGLLDAGLFSTDGYPAVVADERGAVDERVAAESRSAYASAGYQFARGGSVKASTDWFDESRLNGKRSTIDRRPEQNSTAWTSFALRGRLPFGASEIRGAVFGDRVRFRSNFLAVPNADPPRSMGRMSLNQFVPSSSVGGTLQWTRAASRGPALTAGVDWRSVEGESREEVLDSQSGARVILHRRSGGAQNNVGAFVQAIATPAPSLVLTAGARHDRWSNTRGRNLVFTADGTPTADSRSTLPGRSDAVTTPRVSALFKALSALSLWTAAGWGFRAPTLNELYRQFRVGSVVTLANEALGPERLRAVEAGVRLSPRETVVIGATWFDNALRDAVSNVTVSATGAIVTRQRQNLGLTRIRGARVDLDWRPTPILRVSAGYMFNDSVVREFEANPELVGKRLPQVPAHRATAQIIFADPRIAELVLTVLASGRQFDDDLNLRIVPGSSEPGLPGYATVDVLASRDVGAGITAFAGVQNLFDKQVIAGTLPTTVSAPRMLSIGVRWRPTW